VINTVSALKSVSWRIVATVTTVIIVSPGNDIAILFRLVNGHFLFLRRHKIFNMQP
jgi:hypothetical protein